MPAVIGLGGTLYMIAASILGALFVVMAFDCYRKREGEAADRAAKNLFAYSVLYLFLLFAVLLVEQGFGIDGSTLPSLLGVVMQDAEKERQRRQRMRSLAIAWALAALVVLFFIVTMVRLGGNVPPGRSERQVSQGHERHQHEPKGKRRTAPSALSLWSAWSPPWSGSSFASVPLYRMFCQVTGYGGVPQRAEQAPGEVLDRTITIRFDANVDRCAALDVRSGAANHGSM